jgi:hypothetical protein
MAARITTRHPFARQAARIATTETIRANSAFVRNRRERKASPWSEPDGMAPLKRKRKSNVSLQDLHGCCLGNGLPRRTSQRRRPGRQQRQIAERPQQQCGDPKRRYPERDFRERPFWRKASLRPANPSSTRTTALSSTRTTAICRLSRRAMSNPRPPARKATVFRLATALAAAMGATMTGRPLRRGARHQLWADGLVPSDLRQTKRLPR